jgi:hypothetical protein
MRWSMYLALLASWILAVTQVRAVDYEKIDRTILKEPKYKTDSPRYALLLFGPEAKLKAWLVFDGETVYFDRNMDGDLTGTDERFDGPEKYEDLNNLSIDDPDGKTTYFVQGFAEYKSSEAPGSWASVRVKITGLVNCRQYCHADLWNDPKKTAIAHFHGPLTAGPVTNNWEIPSHVKFITGDKPFRIDASIGTFNAKYQCWVAVCNYAEKGAEKSAFPGCFPTIDVEFPGENPKASTIKRHYVLDEFCCGSLFYAKIKVPPEACLGKAKATFAFDAWQEGKVKPTTVELPVVAAEQAKETDNKPAAE